MILYFSATGNSEFAAAKIAERLGDQAVSMTCVPKEIVLKDGEVLGIVTPTYFWGLPSYVEAFLKGISIKNADNAYVFCVATYGGTVGQTDYFIKKALIKKGLKLSAAFGIKTVDNWTVWFDANDQEKIKQELCSEAEQLKAILEQVSLRKAAVIKKHKKSVFMCTMARLFYDGARKTKHLNVSDACIGCGLCADECPVGAIEMHEGKPSWVKDKCTMCFRCLHRCPEFAIDYDGKTQNHGQYVHPKN